VHANQERQRGVVAKLGLRSAIAALCAFGATIAAAAEIDSTPAALAQAMQGHRVVLLGEVHDNPAQHALRLAALRQWIERGARAAIAFEQFDREHQGDIDRARRERPHDADYLIAEAKGDKSWNWTFYRPFVQLALDHDLPIIAANLSRGDAMQVALRDWSAAFDSKTIDALRLNALPADFRRKQAREIAEGHCNQLPAEMLAPRANAQIARDIAMAQSIRPYIDRGVVLLAGNGHVRRDIGVPFWLSADVARQAVSVGLLEREQDRATPEDAGDFDAYVLTDRAERDDPCKQLQARPQR
jgi:uncharacterized iron-regulated protein